jgi:hypothetical protein
LSRKDTGKKEDHERLVVVLDSGFAAGDALTRLAGSRP